MSRLLIGNCSEELVGSLSALSPDTRRSFGWGAQRILWYARGGDVAVLPNEPDDAFLDYVCDLTGVERASLRVLVPASDDLGADVLSAARLRDPGLRDALRTMLEERPVESVVSFYDDVAVAELVLAVGARAALPGADFTHENGNALVNSKAAFRAVAAAAGVPIARGGVTADRGRARQLILDVLQDGHPVMVKREFAGGGLGNEVLAPTAGVAPVGALQARVVPDAEALDAYLDERWDWATDGGRFRVVIERFHVGCVTVYAEFEAADDGCHLRGCGEIRLEPLAAGEVVPPESVTGPVLDDLVAAAAEVCRSFQALGYRGNLCADAVVSPSGEFFFTETNGRLTASTHLHVNLVGHLLSPEHRASRVILERGGRLAATDFPATVARVREAGLAFDPETGTGVVLTANYVPTRGTVTYSVIERDHDAARRVEARLLDECAAVVP